MKLHLFLLVLIAQVETELNCSVPIPVRPRVYMNRILSLSVSILNRWKTKFARVSGILTLTPH